MLVVDEDFPLWRKITFTHFRVCVRSELEHSNDSGSMRFLKVYAHAESKKFPNLSRKHSWHFRGMDVPIILDNMDVDDPRRRLGLMTQAEVEKEYKRGFKLLQKAGLRAEDALEPPLRVALRNPREGLKDDDLSGRISVGEVKVSSKSRSRLEAAGVEPPDSGKCLEDLKLLIPDIHRFLTDQGGSCSLTDILRAVLRPKLGSITQRSFLVAARILDLSSFGLTIIETDDSLILTRPGAVSMTSSIQCECRESFDGVDEWARHVLRSGWDSHGGYNTEISTTSSTCVKCLVCEANSSYQGLKSLVDHCRSREGDPRHTSFGCSIIVTFLYESKDKWRGSMRSLFGQSLEYGDRDFPWMSCLGGAVDPQLSIPFPEGPPTPIYLEEDDDVVEVVDLDSNFINLEE